MSYSAAVLDRLCACDRAGVLPAGPGVGTGEAGSLDEGTLVRISVRAVAGRIAESRFQVFGCSAAIASAGLVAERLEGASIAAARAVRAMDIADALALPAARRFAAELAVQAARAALADAERPRRARTGPAGRAGAVPEAGMARRRPPPGASRALKGKRREAAAEGRELS